MATNARLEMDDTRLAHLVSPGLLLTRLPKVNRWITLAITQPNPNLLRYSDESPEIKNRCTGVPKCSYTKPNLAAIKLL